MGLRAGFTSVPVTPSVPGVMGGYVARDGPSEGVHDDLWARAAVIEGEGVKVALVVADVLAAPRPLVGAVRAEAAPRLGVPPSHVVVAATHTHSGPGIPPFPPDADEAYLSSLARAMAGALSLADRSLRPVLVGSSVAPAEGVGGNRRDPDGPSDPTVTVVPAWSEDGEIRGVLVNHACHPTVLGPSNRLISADLPGAALDTVGRALGDRAWTCYAQGPAGDISCRFTRRAQTFEEARRLGAILGGGALQALERAAPEEGIPLRVASRSVSLPVRRLPPPEETKARLAEARARAEELSRSGGEPGRVRLAQSLVEGYMAELYLGGLEGGLETEAEVTAIRAGGVALVALPGEPFSTLGRGIRERSPFDPTLILGYAGGHVGYVPDREAYRSGGYEALVTWLAPAAADLLVDTAARVLDEVAEGGN